ncbi:unnamed protein product [Kuraishia capsulata CBS 1993]|uniref:Major facilitator superfamily (MFS) profile domain-containing protein n=1 Tax=Kuraishia capsulata CBS 1993 TaxID=1382522 RepID=W6ML99_9ASCO|nr:uncharacterized protein KUCA_T00003247001 [Kuraishia capsulata CBS 1993]CDK27269.1 unnamed protein product [Kuraishia capsulata CBS 1993]
MSARISQQESQYSKNTVQKTEADGQRHGPASARVVLFVQRYGDAIIGAFYVAFTGLVFGYDIGTVGAFFSLDQFQAKFGDSTDSSGITRRFQETTQGLLVGVSCFGAVFGGLFLSRLADIIGRRPTLSVAMGSYALGDLIALISGHWAQLVVGRCFNGLAIGCLSVVTPMLISEFSPVEIRGGLVSVQQLMTTLGIVIGAFTVLMCSRFQSSLQYQAILIVGTIISIGVSGVVFLAPETMNSNNETEETELQNLAQGQEDDAEKAKNENIFNGQPKSFQRLMVGISIASLQQLTGINYFFFYGTYLFQRAGVENPFLTAIILSLMNLVFSVLSVLICERLPRKQLLMLGSAGMMISMLLFSTIGTFLLGVSQQKITGYLMIFFTCLFIAIFALTWGPISGVVLSEMFSKKFKTQSMSIAGATSWFANFGVSFLTPVITRYIGFLYGLVFVFFLLISIPVVYFWLPETRNKSTEEIDRMYQTRSIFS